MNSAQNYEAKLCISDTDMNWYFNNWWDTIIPAFQPSGKYFMAVTYFEQGGVLGVVMEHSAHIQYGVAHYSSDPPIEIGRAHV